MRRQRGAISSQLALTGGAIIVALGIVAGGVLYVQRVRASAFEEGNVTGRRQALLEVAQRDAKALAQAQAEIGRLTAEKDELERRSAERVAEIDRKGQDALKSLESRHRRFLDDLFAGRVRLPGQGRADAACAEGGPRRATPTAAAPGVGDGAAGSYIPADLGKVLGAEASRADAIVLQLTACQGIVRADRELWESSAPAQAQ